MSIVKGRLFVQMWQGLLWDVLQSYPGQSQTAQEEEESRQHLRHLGGEKEQEEPLRVQEDVADQAGDRIQTRWVLHTGRAGGTNSNLIFTKHKFVMLDFLMSALCQLLDNVIIFPIGGVKVVLLNICLFSP